MDVAKNCAIKCDRVRRSANIFLGCLFLKQVICKYIQRQHDGIWSHATGAGLVVLGIHVSVLGIPVLVLGIFATYCLHLTN